LRAELSALPGYDVTGMGTVKLDLAAEPAHRTTRRAARVETAQA
jgi:hypothetical protein